MMSNGLQVDGISCVRGERELFSDLTFNLQTGELLQIVGANGSGKTSLLRMLTGVLYPESGRVLWNHRSIQHNHEYYQNLLYVGHRLGVKSDLTVLENLRLGLHANNRSLSNALHTMRLQGFEDHLCGKLSQGQNQRVALAKLLLSDARIWILDEPLSALDATGVEEVQALFQQQLNDGGMIILSTHRPLSMCSFPVRQIEVGAKVNA